MTTPITLWMTGLSGSGKSTIAERFSHDFTILDGDIIRKGLCSDLGFSAEDRKENLRRLREVCRLFSLAGKDVITAFISPFEEDRLKAKAHIPNCHIVWCKSSLKKCEDRDVKGLYKKARTGEILKFTGISSPYEEPEYVDLVLDTENATIDECCEKINDYIKNYAIIK